MFKFLENEDEMGVAGGKEKRRPRSLGTLLFKKKKKKDPLNAALPSSSVGFLSYRGAIQKLYHLPWIPDHEAYYPLLIINSTRKDIYFSFLFSETVKENFYRLFSIIFIF